MNAGANDSGSGITMVLRVALKVDLKTIILKVSCDVSDPIWENLKIHEKDR
jgi:hypothetical protein